MSSEEDTLARLAEVLHEVVPATTGGIEHLLTVEQAAEVLGLKVDQVRTRMRDNEIAYVDLGQRDRRIKPAALRRYIETRTVKAA